MIRLIVFEIISLGFLIASFYLVYGTVYPMHKEVIIMWLIFVTGWMLWVMTEWVRKK